MTHDTGRKAMRAILGTCALLVATSGLAEAGTWKIGERLSYFCRNPGNSRDNIQYCHNCVRAIGPSQTYVTWTFPVYCDGRATGQQVRGELRCSAAGSEPDQKRAITQNALSTLPSSSKACPR